MFKFKKFTDSSVPSQEEFKKAIPSKGKVFQPGEYTLTIYSIENQGDSKHDANWANVCLTMVGDNKKIKHWLNIPVGGSMSYTHPESSKKNAFSEFLSLQQFVRALGGELEPTVESLNEVLPQLFGDEDVLKDQEVTVEIGFWGNHIKMNDEKMFYIVDRDGNAIDDEEYEQREVAELEAAERGLYIQKFPKILRFVAQSQEG